MSTAAENVTELPTQQVFEGFSIEASLASFSSGKNMPIEGKLAYNAPVSGTFEGRVSGIKFVENKGRLVRVHVIEVLDANFDA